MLSLWRKAATAVKDNLFPNWEYMGVLDRHFLNNGFKKKPFSEQEKAIISHIERAQFKATGIYDRIDMSRYEKTVGHETAGIVCQSFTKVRDPSNLSITLTVGFKDSLDPRISCETTFHEFINQAESARELVDLVGPIPKASWREGIELRRPDLKDSQQQLREELQQTYAGRLLSRMLRL